MLNTIVSYVRIIHTEFHKIGQSVRFLRREIHLRLFVTYGFHRADFHEHHSNSVNFCGRLLYWVLCKSDEGCRKNVHNSIYTSSKLVACLLLRFSRSSSRGYWHHAEIMLRYFPPYTPVNVASTGISTFTRLIEVWLSLNRFSRIHASAATCKELRHAFHANPASCSLCDTWHWRSNGRCPHVSDIWLVRKFNDAFNYLFACWVSQWWVINNNNNNNNNNEHQVTEKQPV